MKVEEEHEAALQKELDNLNKHLEHGYCWHKVDFLEAIWVNTYLFSEDTEYGHFMYDNSKKHLDDQVKACKTLDTKKK